MTDPDYFTLVEFKALPDCGTFTDAQINAAAGYFTAIVEREVGEPFIPRTYTETLDGNNLATLVLGHTPVVSLTSVTLGDTTVSTSTLTAQNGILRYLSGSVAWTRGVQNVVVTYVAGRFATCPQDIKDATMWATRDRLLAQSSRSAVDVRKTSVSNEFGGVTNYVLPGEKRPTGYPDLDAVIASYCRNSANLGFA